MSTMTSLLRVSTWRRGAICFMVVALALVTSATVTASGASTRAGSTKKLVVSAIGFTSVPGEDPDDDPSVSGGAIIENATEKVALEIDVELTFLDARGEEVGKGFADVSWLAPGDVAVVDASPVGLDGEPAKLVVTAKADEFVSIAEFEELISHPLEQGEFLVAGGRAVSASQRGLDDLALQFSDLRYHDAGALTFSSIVGAVSSPTGVEMSDLVVHCAALVDGVVVGAGRDSIGSLPAGASVGVQASGLTSGLVPEELMCSGGVDLEAPLAGVGETYWVTEYVDDPELGTKEARGRVADASDRLEIIDTAGSTGDEIRASAVLRNPTDKIADAVRVDFDYLDESGRVIGHDATTDYLYAGPGQELYVGTDGTTDLEDLDGRLASVAVRVIQEAFVPPDDFARINKYEGGATWSPQKYPLEVTDANYEDGELTGNVVNRSKRALESVRVGCGLFSGGRIVAAGSTTLDDIAEPGTPTPFDAYLGYDGAVDETRCVATLSEGTLNALSQAGR